MWGWQCSSIQTRSPCICRSCSFSFTFACHSRVLSNQSFKFFISWMKISNKAIHQEKKLWTKETENFSLLISIRLHVKKHKWKIYHRNQVWILFTDTSKIPLPPIYHRIDSEWRSQSEIGTCDRTIVDLYQNSKETWICFLFLLEKFHNEKKTTCLLWPTKCKFSLLAPPFCQQLAHASSVFLLFSIML